MVPAWHFPHFTAGSRDQERCGDWPTARELVESQAESQPSLGCVGVLRRGFHRGTLGNSSVLS